MLFYYAPQKYVSPLAFYISWGLYTTVFFPLWEETVSNADQAGFELIVVGETSLDFLIPTFAS